MKTWISTRAIVMTMAAYHALLGSAMAADAPANFKVSEFTFQRPEAWGWVATRSSMRAAQLEVPKGSATEPGEVVFFHFGPGNAGGTQANVERWFGQFQEPKKDIHAKTEERKIGKRTVTYVRAEGTYLSGAPAGPKTPKAGFGLLGAIIEAEQGNVFVKMTGPKPVVQGAGQAFEKMIQEALK